ncbi:MAG TPA: type II toxin-antitoxin system VapC family toxin [Gemmataceae bacterium]|nr:type II toxin-antitoxin system VapC family toxin [Gemmataceae bacterium]
MRVLLDTCILTELRKPDGAASVNAFVSALPSASLFLSVITIGEITKGVALLPDGAKKRSLSRWLVGLSTQFRERVLVVDQETAEIWGELTASARKKGDNVPAADGLIAATSLRHGLHVVTRNTGDFASTGVMVINPWLTASTSSH